MQVCNKRATLIEKMTKSKGEVDWWSILVIDRNFQKSLQNIRRAIEDRNLLREPHSIVEQENILAVEMHMDYCM